MIVDRNHPEFSRGYAYVEYENPEDAEKAIKHMDGGQIDGQEIICAAVLPLREPPRPRRRSPIRRGPPPRWVGRPSPPRLNRDRRRTPSPARRRSPPRRRSRSPGRRRRYSRSSSSSSR